jgi:hypothetical protein
MPSYPPKKGVQYITYIGLVSQANTKLLQSNPTIAAGDFKVSIDGGALANLATLPVVTPASSKMVKVTLSTSEMNGDNVTLVCSDAAGAEWCDLLLNIQTSTRQVDDLAFPTVSGRSTDTTATGAVGIDWANVENPTTAVNLSATNIDVDQVVASVSGAVGSVTAAGTLTTGERDSIAAALLDLANGVETGLTPRQALRLTLAALAGKVSGAATTTVTIRNAVGDSKNRLITTVDADGNRSAITYDLT